MKIGNLDLDHDILIVAEIGNNHEGDYTLAEEMIGLAAQAGVGAVKFQTIIPEKLVSVTQKERIEQLKKFQLSYEQFEKLSKVAHDEGVLFLSTPFDIESARFLQLLVPAFKIASGDNDFYPMIEVIARIGKPIILSTGLADTTQIRRTVNFIEDIWREEDIEQELAILHCVVSYPTAREHANLLAIRELQKLGVTVGYSDHTLGIEAAVLSVALGARIIEKHFTIDKDHSDFHDHKMAADPTELTELVRRVHEARELLGDGTKRLQDVEQKAISTVRRSIAAGRDLEKGSVIQWEDITWVRPGDGLPPGNEAVILGKSLRKPIRLGEMIELHDVG